MPGMNDDKYSAGLDLGDPEGAMSKIKKGKNMLFGDKPDEDEGKPGDGEADEELGGAAGGDASALATKLGVEPMRAEKMLAAAQDMEACAGMSPDEIADKLASDETLRQQVEDAVDAGDNEPGAPGREAADVDAKPAEGGMEPGSIDLTSMPGPMGRAKEEGY